MFNDSIVLDRFGNIVQVDWNITKQYIQSTKVDKNTLYKLLSFSIRQDNLEMVDYLVKNGADISNDRSLFYASSNNNFEMVKYLVEHNVNFQDKYLIRSAVQNDNMDIFVYLIEHGANVNEDYILCKIADKRNIEMMKFILSSGANPNKNDPLLRAIWERDVEMVKCLLDYGTEVKEDHIKFNTDLDKRAFSFHLGQKSHNNHNYNNTLKINYLLKKYQKINNKQK